jgi:hypothetical protein
MGALTNPKWELFAQARARGLSVQECYKAAGYIGESHKAAYRISGRPEVAARVTEIQDEMATASVTRAGLDREWVLQRLKKNIERAEQTEPVLGRDGKPTGEYRYNGSVVNKGLELAGKELGMFADRFIFQDLDGELEGMEPEELRAFVKGVACEVGLRCVEMTDDELRTFILRNAARVGIRLAGSREDPDGSENPPDGDVPPIPETGSIPPSGPH